MKKIKMGNYLPSFGNTTTNTAPDADYIKNPQHVDFKDIYPAPAPSNPASPSTNTTIPDMVLSKQDIKKKCKLLNSFHCSKYLKGVQLMIIDDEKDDKKDVSTPQQIKNLRKTIYTSLSTIDTEHQLIDDLIATLKTIPHCDGKTCQTWKPCSKILGICPGDIYTKITKMIKMELNSTAYMLRVLVNATLAIGLPPPQRQQDKQCKQSTRQQKQACQSQTGSTPICTFSIKPENVDFITGIWEHDKTLIRMHLTKDKSIRGRLVAALGPSASGKTYLSGQILKIIFSNMKQQQKQAVRQFFSIDGGLYRELSVLYQLIVFYVSKVKGYAGFINLVVGWNYLSMFNSSKIKNDLLDYMMSQEKNVGQYDLYVPETQMDDEKMRKYKKLTGDEEYIGLLIYQHHHQGDCPFLGAFACESTFTSGTRREKIEGKIYNNNSKTYDSSMTSALYYACMGKLTLIVHNTGKGKTLQATQAHPGLLISIMYDLSRDRQLFPGPIRPLKEYNILYVPFPQTVPPSIKWCNQSSEELKIYQDKKPDEFKCKMTKPTQVQSPQQRPSSIYNASNLARAAGSIANAMSTAGSVANAASLIPFI